MAERVVINQPENAKDVQCLLMGGHEWIGLPLPMDRGVAEPILQMNYICNRCGKIESYRVFADDVVIDEDELEV